MLYLSLYSLAFFEEKKNVADCLLIFHQAMNLFTYGSQRMQHGQRIAPPATSGGPNEVLSNSIQNGNLGKIWFELV